jgi:hypothetical protein
MKYIVCKSCKGTHEWHNFSNNYKHLLRRSSGLPESDLFRIDQIKIKDLKVNDTPMIFEIQKALIRNINAQTSEKGLIAIKSFRPPLNEREERFSSQHEL